MMCQRSRSYEDLNQLRDKEEKREANYLHESQLTELHSVIAELRRELTNCKEGGSSGKYRIERISEEKELPEEEEKEQDESGCPTSSVSDASSGSISDLDSSLSHNEGSSRRKHRSRRDDVDKTEERKENGRLTNLETIRSHLLQVQTEQAKVFRALKEKDGLLQEALGMVKCLKDEKDVLVQEVHGLKSLLKGKYKTDSLPITFTKYARKTPLRTKGNEKRNDQTARHQGCMKSKMLAETLKQLDSSVALNLINLNVLADVGEKQACSKEELLADLELELIRRERLETELDFLDGKLTEAKAANEGLIGVVGKVESWGCGWKGVGSLGDQLIELYDILVALLESELGLVLANVKAAGIGKTEGENVGLLLRKAEANRDTAINAARAALERDHGPGFEFGVNPEAAIRQLIVYHKNKKHSLVQSIPKYDFEYIEHIMQGGRQRHSAPTTPAASLSKMDMETAILLQELWAEREEKARLMREMSYIRKYLKRMQAKHSVDNNMAWEKGMSQMDARQETCIDQRESCNKGPQHAFQNGAHHSPEDEDFRQSSLSFPSNHLEMNNNHEEHGTGSVCSIFPDLNSTFPSTTFSDIVNSN